MSKTLPPNFTKISESTIKNQKSQQKWWKQFVDKRHHRRKSAIAARLPEDLKDAGTSKGISFDLQSRSPLHDPTSSLITFGPLYIPKSRWQVSHESKIWRIQKITLFAPLSSCHFPSNFLCILSARSATDARSATQVFWKRRQLSGSWLVLVTWDYQEQCEVILRNAATVTEGFPAHFPRSHSRTRG